VKGEHTPGPWSLETVRTSSGICYKIGPFPWREGKSNHACIYVDYPGTDATTAELEANARLITSAPEILSVLKNVRDFLKYAPIESGVCCCGSPVDTHGIGDGHSPVDNLSYAVMDEVRTIEAAIAKATGSSHPQGPSA